MRKLSFTAFWFFLFTLLVKIAGVLRESILANDFGANQQTDQYLFIFSLVSLLMLVAGTTFNHLFLPYYKSFYKNSPASAEQESSRLLNSLFLTSLGAAVLLFAAFTILSRNGIAPSAMQLLRIFALGLPFLMLTVLLDTFLQIKESVLVSALVKILPIAGSICFALFFRQTFGLPGLAIGFVSGSVLAALIQTGLLFGKGMRFYKAAALPSHYSLTAWYLAGQTFLSTLAGPVNLVIDRFFAGLLPAGSLTYLNNASLIAGLPLGLMGAAVGTLYFSGITSYTSNRQPLTQAMLKGLSVSQLIFLPAMIGLFFIGKDFIRLIYEHGAFRAADTASTSGILFGYLPLIWFQGLQLILSKTVYAVKAGGKLFRISLWMVLWNTLLDALFVPLFGAPGLAAASSVVAVVYFLLTLRLLIPYMSCHWTVLFRRSLLPAFIPALIMGISGLWLHHGLSSEKGLSLISHLAVFTLICASIYLLCLLIFSHTYLSRLFRSEK